MPRAPLSPQSRPLPSALCPLRAGLVSARGSAAHPRCPGWTGCHCTSPTPAHAAHTHPCSLSDLRESALAVARTGHCSAAHGHGHGLTLCSSPDPRLCDGHVAPANWQRTPGLGVKFTGALALPGLLWLQRLRAGLLPVPPRPPVLWLLGLPVSHQ